MLHTHFTQKAQKIVICAAVIGAALFGGTAVVLASLWARRDAKEGRKSRFFTKLKLAARHPFHVADELRNPLLDCANQRSRRDVPVITVDSLPVPPTSKGINGRMVSRALLQAQARLDRTQ